MKKMIKKVIVDSFRDSIWRTKNVFLDDSKRI